MSNEIITVDLNGNALVPQEAGNIKDYERELDSAKEKVHNLLVVGTDAVRQVAEIALTTQSTKDFEALSKMLMAVSKLTDQQVALAERKHVLINPDAKNKPLEDEASKTTVAGNQIINNNTVVFEGSPADLADYLARDKKVIDVSE